MNYIYSSGQIISETCFNSIPEDYKSSWKECDEKATHVIEFRENSIYCIIPIYVYDVSQKSIDKRDWFKKR